MSDFVEIDRLENGLCFRENAGIRTTDFLSVEPERPIPPLRIPDKKQLLALAGEQQHEALIVQRTIQRVGGSREWSRGNVPGKGGRQL